jgi:hypothetical protein
MAHYRLVNPNLVVPLDLLTLSWLVYDLDPTRLAMNSKTPRADRLISVIVTTPVYFAFIQQDRILSLFTVILTAILFVVSTVHTNNSIDFAKLRGSTYRQLESVKMAHASVDPNYTRKRAIIFGGLLKTSTVKLMTFGEVVLFRIFAAFCGMIILAFFFVVVQFLGPLIFITGPLIIATNLARLGRDGLQAILRRGPLGFVIKAWSFTDQAEQFFSRRVVRLMLAPRGLFYFWEFVISLIFGAVAIGVFGSFLLGQNTPYLLSILVLLSLGYLPAFVFPAYLSLSLINFLYRQKDAKLPSHPSVWLAYSIGTFPFYF